MIVYVLDTNRAWPHKWRDEDKFMFGIHLRLSCDDENWEVRRRIEDFIPKLSNFWLSLN